MTMVSRFSRQNDAVSRTLTIFLGENLVLVLVRVLDPKRPYSVRHKDKKWWSGKCKDVTEWW